MCKLANCYGKCPACEYSINCSAWKGDDDFEIVSKEELVRRISSGKFSEADVVVLKNFLKSKYGIDYNSQEVFDILQEQQYYAGIATEMKNSVSYVCPDDCSIHCGMNTKQGFCRISATIDKLPAAGWRKGSKVRKDTLQQVIDFVETRTMLSRNVEELLSYLKLAIEVSE